MTDTDEGMLDEQPIDHFLDELFHIAFNIGEEGNSFGLTLTVSGLVVTGTAISLTSWQQLWAEQLSRVSPMVGEGMATVYAADAQSRREWLAQLKEDGLPVPPFRFVQMKDVTIYGGAVVQHVPLWRGRLEQVDGWSAGRLGRYVPGDGSPS